MSQKTRTPANVSSQAGMGSGVYLARVVSHLDPTFMGGLEVTILRDAGNTVGDDTQTFVVKCASPFFGYTGFEYTGQNGADKKTIDGFNDTQKSYGMWFVPPDVGVTVLCVFVDGDPSQGYWIGCIPSRFANHMVPAIGATTNVEMDPDDKKKYATSQQLPVAEVNRRLNKEKDQQVDVDKIKKPLHPIAEAFLTQGLLEDDARGTTSSTSRRETPSMVFGISSPGPLDKRGGSKKSNLGKIQSQTIAPVSVSRLGGTQFVMDDGDDRYQRKKPPSEGPVEYMDVLKGEKGDPTIPYNEHFRIRTRTGHQILLHNSEDLIYIGNSKGTVWIELTSNGKIDIHAEDSISIHTKNDLNIRADRDINMEAGRNVNIKATAQYQEPAKLYEDKKPFDTAGFENGRVYIESVQNMDLLIGRNGKIHVRNDEKIQGNLDIKVMGNMRVSVQDKDAAPTNTNVKDALSVKEEQPEAIKGLHIKSYENFRIKTEKNLDLNTTGNNAFTAGGTTDINSGGNHTETAAQIHMNGPAAKKAEIAEIADKVRPLQTHENPITDNTLEWAKTKYQVSDKQLKSILRRVPMHEPWILHENQAPEQLTPDNTDREA